VTSLLRALDRFVAAVAAVALWLALPMSLLLFLQWPLRDLVARFSTETNDAAQIVFALYVGVAVTYATRCRSHVAADTFASRYSPRTRRRIERIAALVVLVPWALFMLAVAWRPSLQSLLQLESFPETFNPGYFLIRVALVLLALLVLAQAILTVAPHGDKDPS
jgi:TRAP-type mannitol/chloroaromatic compound transport system permease small subunit